MARHGATHQRKIENSTLIRAAAKGKPLPGGFNSDYVLGNARQTAQTHPIWFGEQILQLRTLDGEQTLDENPALSWALDAWQIELAEACADVVRFRKGEPTVVNHDGRNFITVRSMHGPGKTFASAFIVHWFGFSFNQPLIVMTAPKLAQVKTQLISDFERIRQRACPGYKDLMRVDATKICWADDPSWVALAETARQPENLQGKHRPCTLVVVDEASGVPESLWPVIFSALSTGETLILLIIGNPTRLTGTFADSHLKPSIADQYYALHVTLDKTKRVSRDWIAKMGRQYGEQSPVYKVRCLGEFADSYSNQLVPLQWVVDALNRETDPDGSVPTKRISIDVADGGECETIITLATRYQSFMRIEKQFAYSYPPALSPIMAGDEAMRLFQDFHMSEANGDDIVVDSIGVGAGTAGHLIQNGMPVIVYRGGGDSDNKKLWRNRRVQSYLSLRNALRDGRVEFADGFTPDSDPNAVDDMQAQLCSIRTKPGTERVEDLVTKKDLQAEGLKSPDRADSLAMLFATSVPHLARNLKAEPRISTVESTLLEGLHS